MENFKQYFNKGLNADSDFELVEEGNYVNGSNIRFGSSSDGKIDRIESILGTLEIENNFLPQEGDNFCIGSCEDEQNQRIVYCVRNSLNNHAIYCYDKTNMYVVLENSQVEGGLNFSNYIHSCKIIEGLFIFTDDTNEPRCIDIDAAIKTNDSNYVTTKQPYLLPIPYTTITLIKRPPIFRPQVDKYYDATYPNNHLNKKAMVVMFRYLYKNNQYSCLSAYSKLLPYNLPTDPSNSYVINLSFSEKIDDYVQAIEFCVKELDSLKYRVVKTFNKDIAGDLLAIQSHNAGTLQLTYNFYNDTFGILIDDVTAVTSFDDVPILTKTIELAKNRLNFGNNLSGYNTPNLSSIGLSIINTDTTLTSDFAGTWKYLVLHANYLDTGIQDSYMFPYVTKDSDPTLCYYFPSVRNSTAWNGGVGIVPSNINLIDASFSGGNITDLVTFLKSTNYPTIAGNLGTPIWKSGYDNGGTLSAVTVSGFNASTVMQFFKTSGTYLISVAFFDRFRRKSGVVNVSISAKIPTRVLNQTSFYASIVWSLSNSNRLSEIPNWAYYYQIHITENQSTSFFLQSKAFNTSYVKKDSTGAFTEQATFSVDVYGIKIDTTLISNYGLGYIYEEGDTVRVNTSSATELRILSQDGISLILQPTDLGTLNSSTDLLFEIYKPYTKTTDAIFYETGDVMVIANPETTDRAYSTLSGQINGDCYALQRKDKNNNSYVVETMSPNDELWKIWHSEKGWANKVDKIGQQRLKQEIRFTDTIILGTKVNGLNKVQPLNRKSVDADGGEIQKLQLADKEQMQGSVMLALCSNATFSCYLGEQEFFDTKGSSLLAKSDNVIGNIRALIGSNGTLNPESVFEYNGLVAWYDKRNGCFVQYSNNGIFQLSSKKLTRLANELSKYEGLVVGGVDPFHKEFMFSIGETNRTYDKLEDYEDTEYPYYIGDGKPKTLVYKSAQDAWQAHQTINPESFVRNGNSLYSFKDGILYLHNQPTQKLYNNDYQCSIAYSCNKYADMVKTFYGISVNSSFSPDFLHFRTESPFIQSTDLVKADFALKEGEYCAALFRNRLDPNAEGNYINKQMKGEKILGKYLLCNIRFTPPFFMKFINSIFTINQGHISTK